MMSCGRSPRTVSFPQNRARNVAALATAQSTTVASPSDNTTSRSAPSVLKCPSRGSSVVRRYRPASTLRSRYRPVLSVTASDTPPARLRCAFASGPPWRLSNTSPVSVGWSAAAAPRLDSVAAQPPSSR